ncbi:hypothetical protein PHMEG_00031447 [Phytophthora megakarya]|uniref:Uncharacterized protein n=1 Tax=Phytophthora megakarya TaxID=4795 RepID=A0A225UYK6_9STRA|nr:hypothetical protein PHMEG_00031447 [Phytophthora megakarya]
MYPLRAALMRGVFPFFAGKSTSAPSFNRRHTTSR